MTLRVIRSTVGSPPRKPCDQRAPTSPPTPGREHRRRGRSTNFSPSFWRPDHEPDPKFGTPSLAGRFHLSTLWRVWRAVWSQSRAVDVPQLRVSGLRHRGDGVRKDAHAIAQRVCRDLVCPAAQALCSADLYHLGSIKSITWHIDQARVAEVGLASRAARRHRCRGGTSDMTRTRGASHRVGSFLLVAAFI